MGSLSLLQGIFPTKGSNLVDLYRLSHQGSLRILGWVAYPFSRGSSWPRNRTRVSCITGRLFTNWATREAQSHKYYCSFSDFSLLGSELGWLTVGAQNIVDIKAELLMGMWLWARHPIWRILAEEPCDMLRESWENWLFNFQGNKCLLPG